MDKNLKKFMDTPTKSRAQILNEHEVEVQTPDGEIFKMWSDLAKYNSDEYKNYLLHLIEYIFDRNFSDDKEKMINRISWEFIRNAVPSMGVGSGNRQGERDTFIGAQFRLVDFRLEIIVAHGTRKRLRFAGFGKVLHLKRQRLRIEVLLHIDDVAIEKRIVEESLKGIHASAVVAFGTHLSDAFHGHGVEGELARALRHHDDFLNLCGRILDAVKVFTALA